MTTAPPPLDRLLEVALYADEIDRSVEFYCRVLGFDVIAFDDRLTALGVAGQQVLLICRRGASTALARGAHDTTGRQHIAFAVAAADLPAWERRLVDTGVTVEYVREWPRGGRSVYFRDPDDHLIELASPGVWSIY